MRIRNVHIFIVEVPQNSFVAPYRSHVRTSSTTCSGIVRVDTDEGLVGWGEFNVNFLPNIDGNALQRAAEAWAIGRDPTNIAQFHRECPLETRLKSGVEMALWDIAGKAVGLPVASLMGGIVRDRVEVAACMGIQPYEVARDKAIWFVEQGFRSLKTKAGADMQEDLEMVRGVRDAVGDRLKLRIDPNRAYSLDEATELCRHLEQYDLEYLEQPIPAEPLAEAKELRQRTSVPIALNESVIGPDSVLEILREDAAAYLLPDTHIAGGLFPCLTIGRIGEAAGIPCIMHCGHDLGPKTAAMVHVAAACSAYSLANDSTYFGLEDDILTERLEIQDGTIAVPQKPGLGIEGDMERIERYQVK
jgi:L-Ala-D/L-Glu epimerase